MRAFSNGEADHVADQDGDEANLEIGDRDHAVVNDRAEDGGDKAEERRLEKRGPALRPLDGLLEVRAAQAADGRLAQREIARADCRAARLTDDAAFRGG